MNMRYISGTASNRTHNLFRPKLEPIPLSHSEGHSAVHDLWNTAYRPSSQESYRSMQKNQPAAKIAARHTITFLIWRQMCHASDGAGGDWYLGFPPGGEIAAPRISVSRIYQANQKLCRPSWQYLPTPKLCRPGSTYQPRNCADLPGQYLPTTKLCRPGSTYQPRNCADLAVPTNLEIVQTWQYLHTNPEIVQTWQYLPTPKLCRPGSTYQTQNYGDLAVPYKPEIVQTWQYLPNPKLWRPGSTIQTWNRANLAVAIPNKPEIIVSARKMAREQFGWHVWHDH